MAKSVTGVPAAKVALSEAMAVRDRRIAELVGNPESGTLQEIGEKFGLSVPRVHTIAKRLGVVRGPVQYAKSCSVKGCDNPHHSRGLCDMHRQRQERNGNYGRRGTAARIGTGHGPDSRRQS